MDFFRNKSYSYEKIRNTLRQSKFFIYHVHDAVRKKRYAYTVYT